MLDIAVRSKKYNCDLTLEHKVSVILGNSGVGKSLFVKAVTDVSGAYKVQVSQPFRFQLLTLQTWEDTLTVAMDKKESYIYLVDDEDFIFSKRFGELYSKITTSYFVLIVRTQILENDLVHWNGISISAKAIYQFEKDGRNHKIVPINAYNVHTVEGNENVDLCICEDRKSGYQFFKKIFKHIESSDGKDSILKFIKDHPDDIRNRDVYIVVDYSAIGFKIKEIYYYLKLLNATMYLSTKYESFEYLLLKSNFFKLHDDVIKKDLLGYVSLEDRCTELLKSITKGKIYAYNKGSAPLCYFEDCCTMNRSKLQCDKGMSGDKIEAMLLNTDFEFLLKIRQV